MFSLTHLLAVTYGDGDAVSGVVSDVRYIKCAACEAAVAAAHEQMGLLRKKTKPAPSEEQTMTLVENVCKADADEGSWMRSIDLVEQRDAEGGGKRLALVKVDDEGPCGQECRTVALACEAGIEGIENELGEALYAGGRLDVAALSRRACREWSSACKKAPPKLDPARPDGPAFRAFTLEERARREARGPPPPGVLTAEQLRVRLGLTASAVVEGGAQPAPFGSHDSEAHGRGPMVDTLEHSAAFEEAR